MSFDDDAIEAFKHYEDHPVDFCEEIIGAQLDQWQKDALDNLQKHHFLAIRSGSGVGKTALLSLVTMWFLATKPFCKIPTTAPSQHQLYDLLWSEHHKWISRSQFLQDLIRWTQTRLGIYGHEPGWYAVARTAQVSPTGDVAEGLQGFHAEDNLLFLVDEASGVPDAIFPAMEGSLTGPNAYAILAGNPTKTSGYFYDIFNKPQVGKLWKKMHISCYDSPRVESRYITMMEERYGLTHPIFLIKVLGEFATGAINTLVPVDYLDTMQSNLVDKSVSPKMPIHLGVDVGRTNASSILTVRQGFNILKIAEKHKPGKITDTEEVGQWIIEYINAFGPDFVKIDAIGIGAGVYDMLNHIYGARIIPVIGSQRSDQPERFINLRAEGYWSLRELVPKLYCAEWPTRLIAELGDIRLKESPRRDIVQIESKLDMQARSMRSPDYADSLMYACLNPESCLQELQLGPFQFSHLVSDVNDDLATESGSLWQFFNRDDSPSHLGPGWVVLSSRGGINSHL